MTLRLPQGLKPGFIAALSGTTEVVPFHNDYLGSLRARTRAYPLC